MFAFVPSQMVTGFGPEIRITSRTMTFSLVTPILNDTSPNIRALSTPFESQIRAITAALTDIKVQSDCVKI